MSDISAKPVILHDKFVIPTEFPVVIATKQTAEHTFDFYKGKSGTGWLVANDVENCADYIYATDSDKWEMAGKGFAGRTLTMKLTDGNVFSLKGGWHSNAEALLQDTGVDVRDKHETFAVVALRRDAKYLYDVIYVDEKPQIGLFQRSNAIAKEFATKYNEPVVMFCRARTGAIIGMVYK